MAPWISPNKTVEGLVGRHAVGRCSSSVLLHFAGLEPWDQELRDAIWLGLVVAVAAPLGDLAESMLKRDLGVKDMGTLLPGHGGVLDRFDALLFVAPGGVLPRPACCSSEDALRPSARLLADRG